MKKCFKYLILSLTLCGLFSCGHEATSLISSSNKESVISTQTEGTISKTYKTGFEIAETEYPLMTGNNHSSWNEVGDVIFNNMSWNFNNVIISTPKGSTQSNGELCFTQEYVNNDVMGPGVVGLRFKKGSGGSILTLNYLIPKLSSISFKAGNFLGDPDGYNDVVIEGSYDLGSTYNEIIYSEHIGVAMGEIQQMTTSFTKPLENVMIRIRASETNTTRMNLDDIEIHYQERS